MICEGAWARALEPAGNGISRRNGSGQALQVDFSPKEQQGQESRPWRTSCRSIPCTSVEIPVGYQPLGTASPGLASFCSLTRSANGRDRLQTGRQEWNKFGVFIPSRSLGHGLAVAWPDWAGVPLVPGATMCGYQVSVAMVAGPGPSPLAVEVWTVCSGGETQNRR